MYYKHVHAYTFLLQLHVQAFSKAEGTAAKQLKVELESFQERTDQAWKEMRWIEEAVQRGRNQSNTLLPVKVFRESVRANLTSIVRRGNPFALLQLSLPAPPPLSITITPFHASIFVSVVEPSSGYLRVFPAYTTGLISGTSVRVCVCVCCGYRSICMIYSAPVHILLLCRHVLKQNGTFP